MGLRDIVVAATLLGALPVCLLRPWIGLLVWAWIAFMNPHRQTWGFAYDMPFAQWVALATLLGFLFAKKKPFTWNAPIVLLTVFWAWMTVTTMFAVYPHYAWDKYEQVFKILLMAYVGIPLLQDRWRLRALLLVIVVSLGYYGAKGGLFALMTGGNYMVLGPADTFLAANTELSLALNMSVPMQLYLARDIASKWGARALKVSAILTMVAVPFTYSRSGVVGLACVLVVLFLKSRAKATILPVIAVGVVAVVAFAPPHWIARMQTIKAANEDESFNLRQMSWEVSRAIALEKPIFGGGFRVFWDIRTYEKYVPHYPNLHGRGYGHDAHSIYFNILGEHGPIGLGLFGAMVGATFVALRRVHRWARDHAAVAWAANYAHMFEVSLVGWLVTGLALSAAYFDLAYQVIVLSAVLVAVVQAQVRSAASGETAATAPAIGLGRPALGTA